MPSLLPTSTSPSLPAPASEQGTCQNSSTADILAVDVAIVGGGIAGLTLAVALRYSGLQVAVIEAQSAEQSASRRRAYALSLTSGEIFRQLGVWGDIAPHITHFQNVRLSDADYPQVLEFHPEDSDTEAVYYGAEHGVLMAALQQAAQASETLSYLDSTTVTAVDRQPHKVRLELQTATGVRYLQAPLLVAADGMKSPLRQQANIRSFGLRYWQSCITAVLKPELPHQETAYERFWPSGPFAILPLPGNRCQIVWTAPHQEAATIMEMSPDQFMAALQQRYGKQMGQLTLMSKPLMFPVQLMQSHSYVQPRLALIGDAAHCCHPVGGQGLNMGIRDAAALAEVLAIAHRQKADLGSLAVLRRYSRWRQLENTLILSLTDFLTRCFSNRIWPVMAVRRLGILILRNVPSLRRLALRVMTGRFGRIPQNIASSQHPDLANPTPSKTEIGR